MKGKSLAMSHVGLGALFAAAFIWGTSFVMMKDVSDKLPPSLLLAIRFSAACLVLAVVFIKRMKKLDKKHLLAGSVIGAIVFAAYLVQTYGLIGTTPGKNAFLTATYCVVTPFLFWVVTRKKPNRFHLISAAVCLVGIFLISVDLKGESLTTIALGDILTLICGFFYGGQIVAISLLGEDKDPIVLTVVEFGVAGVLSWIAFGLLRLFGQAPIAATAADVPSLFWQMIYLTVFCTAVALFCQNFGQRYANPTSAAVILTFEAVFGALFSILLGREKGFDVWRGLGFVFVFSAVVISETKLSFIHKKFKKTSKNKVKTDNVR